MSQSNLSLEELYQKFKNTPANLRHDNFDDEDLLDIYDFAVDINDNATQAEIIGIADRLYADDEEFKIRKAYFLLSSSQFDKVREIAESLPEDSLQRHILLTRIDDNPTSGTREKLFGMLMKASRKSIDDETIIRFFETVASEQELDRLIDNRKSIENRCFYRDTFIYELAICCNDFRRYDKALVLAKELTAIDPFEAKFWYLQASIEGYGLSRIDDAESDASYAMAISPSFDHTKLLLAYLSLYRQKDLEQGLKHVDEVIESGSNNHDAMVLGALLAHSAGNHALKASYISMMETSGAKPSAAIALRLFLDERHLSARSAINPASFYLFYTDRLNFEVTPEWIIAASGDDYSLAAALLILYDSNSASSAVNMSLKAFIAEYLDKASKPEYVITFVQEVIEAELPSDVYGLLMMYFYFKAGIEIGECEAVKSDLEFIMNAAKQYEKTSDMFFDRIQIRGLIGYLEELKAKIQDSHR